METPKPLEIAKTTVEVASDVGHFVVERLLGGGWAELADKVKQGA